MLVSALEVAHLQVEQVELKFFCTNLSLQSFWLLRGTSLQRHYFS